MIRRMVLAATVLVHAGCSTLQPVSFEPRPNYASLQFVDLPRAEFPRMAGVGMWAVDQHRFKTAQMHLYIAQGKRSIRWLCSAWIAADDYPQVDYVFEPNTSYEMVCEDKGPVFRQVDR